MIVAGIDIGNSTTELLVARVDSEGVVPLAVRRKWTTGIKGSEASAEGAARLLAHAERALGVACELVLLARLQPVLTLSAKLPPALTDPAGLRLLNPLTVTTPAGRGFAVGAHLPLSALSVCEDQDKPVVVSVPRETDFEDAAHTIAAAQDRRVLVVGALAGGDDAVLIANRIRRPIPIVDEAQVDDLSPGVLIALEVAEPGASVRTLSDPIALAAAFGLPPDAAATLTRLARELADAPCAALASRSDRQCLTPDQATAATISYDEAGTVKRIPFDSRTVTQLDRIRPGAVRAIHAPSGTALHCAVSPAFDRVRDVFAVDLPSLRERFFPQAGAVKLDDVPISLLVRPADSERPTGDVLAELTGRAVRVVATEAEASALGARTTPAAPPSAAVCDMGGGTVHLVATSEQVTVAGAGELLTESVAIALGLHRTTAEYVKRYRSLRVETPHTVHDEDGTRRFVDAPMPPATLARLCYMRGDTPMPFADRLAPEEWGSLRLAIKRHVIGASVSRCLRWLPERPRALLVCGGAALDTESVRIVAETVRRLDITVGRANVNGSYGPRCAVALGLILALRRSEATPD